jgi:hypothetical protein
MLWSNLRYIPAMITHIKLAHTINISAVNFTFRQFFSTHNIKRTYITFSNTNFAFYKQFLGVWDIISTNEDSDFIANIGQHN